MERKQHDPSLAWGRHAVTEALAAGHPINRIYLAREAEGEQIEQIKELARQRGIRFDFVDVGRLGRLSGTRDHQDVVARLSPVPYLSLEELLGRLDGGEPATLVALDRLQNPRNVGMIIRTAWGAGVRGILLPARGGRLVNEEVIRASAGAAYRLPLVTSPNLARDLQTLTRAGFWIYGLDARAERDLYTVEWPARRVLVAGNEGTGLRPQVRKALDERVRIPLAEGLDSLNVAMATGIVLFEIARKDSR